MRLLVYIIRRLLLLIPVLIGVTLITFAIGFVIPTDPVHAWCGQKCDANQMARIREWAGFDLPWYQQYWNYITRLSHLDFGLMPSQGFRPVSDELSNRFPATIELTSVAMLFAVILGVPTGIISATRKDRIPDHLTRAIALSGVSIPIFWLGIMLLWLFYGQLGFEWFAPVGRLNITNQDWYTTHKITGIATLDALAQGNFEVFKDAALHLVLPGFALAYTTMALITRMMRSSMLEVLGQDYIKAARAKGLSERVVIKKHAKRNAMIPTTTVIGLSFGALLGGAVLTETVFTFPGMGQWAVTMLVLLDFTGVMALTYITALIYVSANLVVDIIYAYLDPRIKLE
ncbi:MAG: ABC transporter permease [Methanobacteriota archaeon]|nr:MAG: ABC transporter permease [Euryarchaeota archaeon]